ncbi:Rv3235 family protein [Gordonia sp. (in: high G+C Gram-positive bacteria)]|uniref:Rv3235 family protein n=1 Tax=unclassified Gordonia (in: high G+C Gram-positive bacteria) TaxID=2657482 RepID=UPI00260FFEB0|nr:Rv3235 family protein [Gordonia sp. (in: high G+C Gram-positive bacteria)]
MRGTLLDTQPGTAIHGPRPKAPAPDLQVATAARSFAIAVVARTLEVLDGKRPRGQLAGAVSDDVLTQIATLLQLGAGGPDRESARLHRVHVQLRSSAAAEIFGTYVRGPRTRAFAGAMETAAVRVSARGAQRRELSRRWVVTEFAIL